jgi:predicted kinase
MNTAMAPSTLHLVCGATGAGKTTHAIALAEREGAVRFSIDEWMTRLFWADSPQPIRFDWAIERVNRCEGQIAEVALRLGALGVSSVLDLGFTRAEHRAKFEAIGRAAGLAVKLHLVDVDPEERWRRVQGRNADKGETYRLEVTREMFDFMEGMWEPPDDAEMARLRGVRTT